MGLAAPALMPAIVLVALATSSPREEFDRGRTAFLRGQYQRVISMLYFLFYFEL